MEDARRWGSIDSFVEWQRFRAPEEAFTAGSDGEDVLPLAVGLDN